jgi:hypothetical protein
MALEDDVKTLGLQRCDFDDECEFCDNPQGGSWVQMFVAEGVTEAEYYVCANCIPSKAAKFTADLERDYEHYINQPSGADAEGLKP